MPTTLNEIKRCASSCPVLVVGGLGFIGSRVARQLSDLGADVAVADRCLDYGARTAAEHARVLEERRRRIGSVRFEQLDACAPGAIAELLREHRTEVLVHLANVPVATFAADDPVTAAREMLVGIAVLLVAARDAGVRRFVYVSSSMVYGDFLCEPAAESHPLASREPYGALKCGCEHLVRSFTTTCGLDHAIVRPTAVYGPDGNPGFVISRFLEAVRSGGTMRVRGADSRLDFTHVDDAAWGIVLAAMHPAARNGTFNVSFGAARGLLEAARLLQDMHPESRIVVEPADPLYPRRGALDIGRARTVLGFRPRVPLEEGMRLCHAG